MKAELEQVNVPTVELSRGYARFVPDRVEGIDQFKLITPDGKEVVFPMDALIEALIDLREDFRSQEAKRGIRDKLEVDEMKGAIRTAIEPMLGKDADAEEVAAQAYDAARRVQQLVAVAR